MIMKKFLFITYAFPPQLSPASISIAKILKYIYKSDWRATVICAKNETTLDLKDHALLNFIPKKEIYIKEIPYPEKNFFLRVFLYFITTLKQLPDLKSVWYFPASRAVKNIFKEQNFNLLFSWSSYIVSHIVGLYVKKNTNLPWIAYFSDPWTDNPYKKFNKLAKIINLKIEKKVVENADKLIFNSAGVRDLMMQKYTKKYLSKTVILPHYFDPCLYPKIKNKKNTKCIFTHTGNFYGLRTPVPLFLAIKKLIEEKSDYVKNIEFIFIGAMPMEHKKIIKKLGIENIVKTINIVSYLKSLEYMKKSDYLLIIDAPSKKPSVFQPAKTIDYLGAKKPILAITTKTGQTAERILSLQVGEIADIENIENIKNKIIKMYKNWQNNDNKYIINNSKIEPYNVKNVSKQLIEIFNQTIK